MAEIPCGRNVGDMLITATGRDTAQRFETVRRELMRMFMDAVHSPRRGKGHEFQDTPYGRGIWALSRYCAAQQGAHSYHTARIARKIGEYLGLEADELSKLTVAAELHDIGKLVIDPKLLDKDDVLTAEEYGTIQQHTVLGHDLLTTLPVPGISFAAEVALSHHEHWDGTGYPNHARGNDIPLFARITALADVSDALMAVRPYKKPWSLKLVRNWVEQNAPGRFDPDILSVFLQHFDTIATSGRRAASGDSEDTLLRDASRASFLRSLHHPST